MSKIVTATAANRLVDEGRLDLFAPADEYVDYLRVPGTPNVGQLLNHTAGFVNPMPIRWVHPAGADPPDPEALLRRLMGRRRACRHPVGQGARYSHVGYLAAGKVIAAASGVPFETYVHDSVLRPEARNTPGSAIRTANTGRPATSRHPGSWTPCCAACCQAGSPATITARTCHWTLFTWMVPRTAAWWATSWMRADSFVCTFATARSTEPGSSPRVRPQHAHH